MDEQTRFSDDQVASMIQELPRDYRRDAQAYLPADSRSTIMDDDSMNASLAVAAQKKNVLDRERRAALWDSYGESLVDRRPSVRMKAAREAAKKITDPQDAAWMAQEIGNYAKAIDWSKRKAHRDRSYIGRFLGDVNSALKAGPQGFEQALQSGWQLGRTISGGRGDTDQLKREIMFQGAYAAEHPDISKDFGVPFKTAIQALQMGGQMAPMFAGYKIAGDPAMFAVNAPMMGAQVYEQEVASGASPEAASKVATGVGIGQALIEQTVRVPGLSKGFISNALIKKVAPKVAGKKLLGKIAVEPIVSAAIPVLTGTFGESIGEEVPQAVLQAAGHRTLQKARGETPPWSDISVAGWEAAKQSVGPIAMMSAVGGAAGYGKIRHQEMVANELIKYGKDGKAPSRTTWTRRWQLPLELAPSRTERLQFAQSLSTEYNAVGSAEAARGLEQKLSGASIGEIEKALGREQVSRKAVRAANTQWAEQLTRTFQSPEALSTAYDAEVKRQEENAGVAKRADKTGKRLRKALEAEPWFAETRRLRQSGQRFKTIFESARKTMETSSEAGRQQLADEASTEDAILSRVGPKPTDWHIAPSDVSVPNHPNVESKSFGDRVYWRMNTPQAGVVANRATDVAPAGQQAGVATANTMETEAPQAQREGLLAGESGALRISLQQVVDDSVAGMTGKEAEEAVMSPIPEVRARQEQAFGATPQSRWKKFAQGIMDGLSLVVRQEAKLPQTQEFDGAREVFRRFRMTPAAAMDASVRQMSELTKDLGPLRHKLLSLWFVAKNQLFAYEKTGQLRTGFTDVAQVQDEYNRLQKLVDAEPSVKQAIGEIQSTRRALVEQAVSLKILPSQALEHVDEYMHQQILHYVNEGRSGKQRGETVSGYKAEYQRQRVKLPQGEQLHDWLDPNTNFVEPELAFRAKLIADIEDKKSYNKLVDDYDIIDQKREEAEKKGVSLENLMYENPDDTHALYIAYPGEIADIRSSKEGQLAEALEEDILFGEADLTDAELTQIQAMNNRNRLSVLPKPIIAQLRSMRKPRASERLTQFWQSGVSAWKAYNLMMPKRLFMYNVRNLLGDLDAVLAGDPEILKNVGKSFRECKTFFTSAAPLSETLRASRDNGVILSGWSAQELQSPSKLNPFSRFSKDRANRLDVIGSYFGTAQTMTEFREGVLRHAAFLHYLKKIKDGKLSHYGASSKHAVDTTRRMFGDEAAAGKLARELLGDYGSLTVLGNFLRSYGILPFWAFQEINLKRWPHIAWNAFNIKQGRNRAMAVLSKLAVMRIGYAYAMYWSMNNFIMPLITGSNLEDELSEDDRIHMHLTLGKMPDGRIAIIRNVGALPEFLNALGDVPEILQVARDIYRGKRAPKDLATTPIKNVVQYAAGQTGPISTGISLLTGQRFYPNVTDPRQESRLRIFFQDFLAAGDEAATISRAIVPAGQRSEPNYFLRFAGLRFTDPAVNAVNKVREDVELWRRMNKGIGREPVYPPSLFRNGEQAVRNGNFDAFNEWRKWFIEQNGGDAIAAMEKARRHFDKLDPTQRLNSDDRYKFEQSLDTAESYRLDQVRDYSRRIGETAMDWWFAEPLSPAEEQEQEDVNVDWDSVFR